MLDLLRRQVPELSGARVAVLGMAFKPGTDDVRESPSLFVTRALVEAGALVTAFDPVAREEAEKALGVPVQFADTLEEATDGVDAVLVMTRWQQFDRLPGLIASRGQSCAVIDGRRMLSKDDVERYEGIGL
jgi:UDPglucose 6-dehydrogenase/GDP-mannose 6-dehydrogenase